MQQKQKKYILMGGLFVLAAAVLFLVRYPIYSMYLLNSFTERLADILVLVFLAVGLYYLGGALIIAAWDDEEEKKRNKETEGDT